MWYIIITILVVVALIIVMLGLEKLRQIFSKQGHFRATRYLKQEVIKQWDIWRHEDEKKIGLFKGDQKKFIKTVIEPLNKIIRNIDEARVVLEKIKQGITFNDKWDIIGSHYEYRHYYFPVSRYYDMQDDEYREEEIDDYGYVRTIDYSAIQALVNNPYKLRCLIDEKLNKSVKLSIE